MDKKIIAISSRMRGLLDDEYTLYDDGTLKHYYDKHTYPGGQDITEFLTVDDLNISKKNRIYEDASNDSKELVRKVLKLDKK